ncbi:hypothetical protein ABZ930_07010 [Streptomyces sp. NPDC046716]|uniref:hypothetical protein n=1 Tax=Streptomyces sp. NPDC046716 TaxID=3157093 RepID=UPI0033F243FF
MAETAKTEESTKPTTAARSTGRSAVSKASAAAKKTKSAAAGAGHESAGHAVALASKAKAGGEFLSTVPAKSVHVATTVWGFVKHRRAIAIGAGSGVVAGLAGAFALGRGSARRGQGPITRWTGGRF